MDNIVLIGAPGCGKSMLGRLLAKRLQLPFFDTDEYIEKKERKSIKDIFINGEAYFRNIESICLEEILNEEGKKVIATGGGIVKFDRNIELLKNNTIILFINRPVEQIADDIDISNRPLLSADPSNLFTLYKERYPLYKKCCDYEIENNRSVDAVLDDLVHLFK